LRNGSLQKLPLLHIKKIERNKGSRGKGERRKERTWEIDKGKLGKKAMQYEGR
jgi:hypothetical protein